MAGHASDSARAKYSSVISVSPTPVARGVTCGRIQVRATGLEERCHLLSLLHAAKIAEGSLKIGDFDFQPRNFVLDRSAAFLHLAKLDGVEAAIDGLGWFYR